MSGRSTGFTLIELLVTLAIVALLASIVVPVAELALQRQREQELRIVLREIRSAIDAYKRAVDEGRIVKGINETGYPKTLDTLVEGIPDAKDPQRRKLYFMRRLPRDPMHPDAAAAAADTWGKRSYASEPDDPREGDDVFDVFTRSLRVGLNGVPYAEW